MWPLMHHPCLLGDVTAWARPVAPSASQRVAQNLQSCSPIRSSHASLYLHASLGLSVLLLQMQDRHLQPHQDCSSSSKDHHVHVSDSIHKFIENTLSNTKA